MLGREIIDGYFGTRHALLAAKALRQVVRTVKAMTRSSALPLERETVLATETLDSSDMGKLIVHIKGYAAKLEAEKVRERTGRGIRARAQLAHREKQKARVWKAFQIAGDEGRFRQSIGQLAKEVEALQREESRLEQEIETNRRSHPELKDVEKACELVRQKLKGLSVEEKRQALEALQVRVWVDADQIDIEGAIPIPHVSTAPRPPP